MSNIFVLGDIHGKVSPVENLYRRNKGLIDSTDKNFLILLGDAGLNYYLNGRDEKTKKKLSKFPFTYFIIRGNHEERPSNLMKANPKNWFIQDFWDGLVYVENGFENILYASDIPSYYKIPIADKTYSVLSLPGAYSVDKFYRIMNGKTWFKDEQMTDEEMNLGIKLMYLNNHKADIVLSHTCPSIYEPSDLFLSNIDQNTVDRSMEIFLTKVDSLSCS